MTCMGKLRYGIWQRNGSILRALSDVALRNFFQPDATHSEPQSATLDGNSFWPAPFDETSAQEVPFVLLGNCFIFV